MSGQARSTLVSNRNKKGKSPSSTRRGPGRPSLREKAEAGETKDRLLEVAVDLFAAKGFEATTVKDLATAARANVSLISYYFGSKEGLYRELFQRFGLERLSAVQEVLKKPQSREDFRVRLTLFCEGILKNYVEKPNLHLLVLRECDQELPRIEDIFEHTLLACYETLRKFMTQAQEMGFVRMDRDTKMVSGFILVSLLDTARNDRINKRFYGTTLRNDSYRYQVVDQLVSTMLDGCVIPADAPLSSKPSFPLKTLSLSKESSL